ncbi:neuroligin-1 [Folsomia candida]|uniref:neuroligin-1 n=1 Tax=Folsomia candida TaxID=158441 RepID=UPI0016050871|nr:neuroligin-1 [Folsomia candida]XP_035709830.1 neuroligin-1 [Folsomia candida]
MSPPRVTGGWVPRGWIFTYNLAILVILLFSLVHQGVPKYSQRTVKTAYGELRGVVYPKVGSLVKDVEAFLGVPYASAPAASLRFMPPLTPSRWTGVRVADKMGPVCPQLLPDLGNRSEALSKMPLLKFTRVLELAKVLTNQSEDCLYLNIFMPLKDARGKGFPSSSSSINGGDGGGENMGGGGGGGESASGEGGVGLAIVVILQGESWEWGSGNVIDGSSLASYGHVMVITLNYRLNVLGFLQTTTQQGNYALMDVVAALHWIRENAGAFGGDINRITVLGHRTGAVIANFLMLAPVASELFHRVILLSGSALSPWSFQRHSKNNVRKLAEQLKCLRDKSPPGVTTLFNPTHRGGQPGPHNLKGSPVSVSAGDALPDVGPCLRLVPGDELLASINSVLLSPRFLARFGPLIDSSVVKSDFVAEMKFDNSGRFSRFPLLIGTSTVESFGELNTEDIEDGLSEGKRDRVLRTFVRNVFVFHLNEIYSTIKNEYTDWEKPRKDFIDVRDSILNILSDGLTVAPLIQVASMHSAKANAKTFLFHFQYEPDSSVYPNRIGSISEDLLEFAAGHALLDQKTYHQQREALMEPSLPSFSANDAKVSKSLMHYLTNFIISGDPNSGYDGSSVEDAQLPFWDSYDPINQFYLEIGSGEPRMKSHYRGHKMALWLNLIPQLHQSGGSDVAMLHHNFRDERPEFYEGVVREQLKHQTGEDLLAYPAAGSAILNKGHSSASSREGGKPPEAGDGEGGGAAEDGEDYGGGANKGAIMYPTLSPAVMSTSECPPNTTNSTGMLEGGPGTGGASGDRDLVRQLAAAHYHSYGTALGVTIGVGCCLLLLNLLIFLAIYHQKTHTLPTSGSCENKHDHNGSQSDEESQLPLPTTLSRPRSHPDLRHGFRPPPGGASTSVPALYNDDEGTDDYDDDIVQELRECTGGGHSSHSSTFRMNPNKELSSSSGFSSPSIPDPPPPPRAVSSGAVTFASLTRGSVRILKRDDSRDFGENGGFHRLHRTLPPQLRN